MMTLSDIIKNRGIKQVNGGGGGGGLQYANYNDMIDEVFSRERRGI